MVSNNEKIKLAYKKGYRVTDDGILLNPDGLVRKPYLAKSQDYPSFTVNINGKSVSIKIHRFAAYCFYKDDLFKPKVQVRHLISDVMDFSKKNIKLGTKSQNELDKPKHVRQEQLRKRNAARKRILTEDQITDVRRRIDAGLSITGIANLYNVNRSTIYRIKNKEGIYGI